MAEEASTAKCHSDKPAKGILKHAPSHDEPRDAVHWDEMNILQTYHPSDKDYGHMKINEPPTPYNYQNDSDSEEHEQLDPAQLAQKIQHVTPENHVRVDSEDNESDNEQLTPEQQEAKRVFVDKRKHHYNEYEKVKLARELIEKEMAEMEDDDN